jgi:hypothetical protein
MGEQPKRRTFARTPGLAFVVLAAMLVAVVGQACACTGGDTVQTTAEWTTGHAEVAAENRTEATGPDMAAGKAAGDTTATADGASTATITSVMGVPAPSTGGADHAVATGTTAEPLYVSPDTTVSAQCLQGTVLGGDGRPVAGATVCVVINASDPLYRGSGSNVVGTASTDASGSYRVLMRTVPLGTVVDVSAVKMGYASVLMYGIYQHEVEEVDFADYGGKGGDRRLPVGDQVPPLPFEDLLPGRGGT